MIFQFEEDILIDIIGSAIGGILFVVVSIITFNLYIKKRTKAILFFFLTWLMIAMYFLFESLSVAFQDPLLYKIDYSIILPLSLGLWMVFLDYTQKDEISWKKMMIASGMFMSLFIYMWHPASNLHFDSSKFPDYWQWTPSILGNWYYILSNSCIFILGVSFFLWTVVTFRAAPKIMRRQTTSLLVSGIIMLVAAFVIFVQDLLLVVFVCITLSSFISTTVISRDPKITHVLPYKVYRLIITSKGGTPYYQHNWSEHEINTILLSGLFSAIGSMAKATLEDLNVGTIKEVRLQNGVFLTETQYSPVNVGLLASKTSVELKAAIAKFTKAFLEKYYKQLYNEDGFPVDITKDPAKVFLKEDMTELIEDNFSNIPSYIIPGLTTDALLDKASARADGLDDEEESDGNKGIKDNSALPPSPPSASSS
ncbi:MAG: hypothetical protein ACTSUE_18060 [Promethearchaeota archaeon]